MDLLFAVSSSSTKDGEGKYVYTYSENIMDRDVLGHSNHQRDLSLNGLFDGLCCLVTRYVNGRCIGLCSLLRLHIRQSIRSPPNPTETVLNIPLSQTGK